MTEAAVPDPSTRTTPEGGTLAVVVPVYNEEEVVREFHGRLGAVLDSIQARSTVLYVNDGSSDRTLETLLDIRRGDPRVEIIDLSRNFGKEIALTAGLDHTDADAVVVIDADLQDPPELIPELVQGWRDGYDVVYAQRAAREGEGFAKRATAYTFYRLIQRVSRVRIPEDAGDFRLLSRRVVQALRGLRERNRFMKGLFAWVGFKQRAVRFQRHARFAGRTKWNYWKLWNFALEGFTSFTTAPLKIATYVGLTIATGALVFALIVVYKTLVYGEEVRGYPSLMVVVLFLGGAQLMTIGILGEYVGRMFDETKGRPLYLVQAHFRSGRGGQDLQERPPAP
jgi:glycosyltransferase involved in cell wall biosynthesis